MSEGVLDWQTSTLPVLSAVGTPAYSREPREAGVSQEAINARLGRPPNDPTTDLVLAVLLDGDYLTATVESDQVQGPLYCKLAEKGRQAVAGWPGADGSAAAAGRLLAALDAEASAATTEEERTRVKRAGTALGPSPRQRSPCRCRGQGGNRRDPGPLAASRAGVSGVKSPPPFISPQPPWPVATPVCSGTPRCSGLGVGSSAAAQATPTALPARARALCSLKRSVLRSQAGSGAKSGSSSAPRVPGGQGDSRLSGKRAVPDRQQDLSGVLSVPL